MACPHADRTTCSDGTWAVQHGALCGAWHDRLLREKGGSCEQKNEWKETGTSHNYPSKFRYENGTPFSSCRQCRAYKRKKAGAFGPGLWFTYFKR
jgi:hypothetical protein